MERFEETPHTFPSPAPVSNSPTVSTKQHVTSLPPIRVHMVVIVVEVVVAVVVGVVVMAVTMMVVVVVRVAMDEQMAISEWPAQAWVLVFNTFPSCQIAKW